MWTKLVKWVHGCCYGYLIKRSVIHESDVPTALQTSTLTNQEEAFFAEGQVPEGYDHSKMAGVLQNTNTSESIKMRKELTPLVFRRILPWWLFFTATVMLLAGRGILKYDAAVLATFLGTSFAQVVGLAYIVANYFFNPRNKD